eukprot:COSAG01_NODE_6190_length_3803_cov_3.030238_2_plen_148_part_00
MDGCDSPTFSLLGCPVLIVMLFEQAATAAAAAVSAFLRVHRAAVPQVQRVHGACAGGGGAAERTHTAVGKRLEAAEASDSSAEGGALCWVVELAHRGDAVSQNGWLLSRRGRSRPASVSGFDTHRDSITSCFELAHLGDAVRLIRIG